MMKVEPQLADLGIRLGETVVRNTANSIFHKIQAVKARRDEKATIQELEDIISDLIDDRNELVQIAQAYEQEFVAQQISPEEIKYITDSFIPVLKNLIQQTSSGASSAGTTDMGKTIDSLTPLLSVEMLTVLQLVGFNFKKAIGEPLTFLLQKLITSKVSVNLQADPEYSKLLITLQTEALKIAQDKDATNRWEQLRSKGIL